MRIPSISTRAIDVWIGLILIISSLSSCQAKVVASVHPTPPITNQVIAQMLREVDPQSALKHLRELSGEDPLCVGATCRTISNRVTGGEDLRWATDYIYRELAAIGYSVEVASWSASGYSDRNVIARKSGTEISNEEIYVVAHVDGVEKSEQRYPAADDNASGVTDLLELARLLYHYSFDRAVVLFFSTGEEKGSLGVKQYLGNLHNDELKRIAYVVNVDMIGYDANADRVMQLRHGNNPPSIALAERFRNIIDSQQIKLSSELAVGCG